MSVLTRIARLESLLPPTSAREGEEAFDPHWPWAGEEGGLMLLAAWGILVDSLHVHSPERAKEAIQELLPNNPEVWTEGEALLTELASLSYEDRSASAGRREEAPAPEWSEEDHLLAGSIVAAEKLATIREKWKKGKRRKKDKPELEN